MEIKTIQYDSFDQFFSEIIYIDNTYGIMSPKNRFIFRGESTNRHTLLPSILRDKNQKFLQLTGYCDRLSDGTYHQCDDPEKSQVEAEYRLLKEFFSLADRNGLPVPNIELIRRNCTFSFDFFTNEHLVQMTQTLSEELVENKWIQYDLVELAALAQHYGIPTRLLDWTFDIFVALYFAASGARERHIDNISNEDDMLVVWALNYEELSFPANREIIPLKFVVPPYNGNPNLYAQKGILTYWETKIDHSWTWKSDGTTVNNSKRTNREPLDKLLRDYNYEGLTSPALYKFKIPAKDWAVIQKYLIKFDYSTSRLFPGFSGVANEIKERYD